MQYTVLKRITLETDVSKLEAGDYTSIEVGETVELTDEQGAYFAGIGCVEAVPTQTTTTTTSTTGTATTTDTTSTTTTDTATPTA